MSQTGIFKIWKADTLQNFLLYINWREGEVLVCTFTYKKYKTKITFVSYLQNLIKHFSNVLLLL
jgi:hypothetical protein